LKNGWAEMKNRKILSGVMGVYIFKFLGDSGDGITWCKVGYHGTLDPWQRVKSWAFVDVNMPTRQMLDQMHVDLLELVYWWPELEANAENVIHENFVSLRTGEWYSEQHIPRVVEFVCVRFGIQRKDNPLVITIPARSPFASTAATERRLIEKKRSRVQELDMRDEQQLMQQRQKWGIRKKKKERPDIECLIKWRRYHSYFTTGDDDDDEEFAADGYDNPSVFIYTFVESVSFTVNHAGLYRWLCETCGFVRQKIKGQQRLRTTVQSPLLQEMIRRIQSIPATNDEDTRDELRRVVRCVRECLAQSRISRRMTVTNNVETGTQWTGHMYAFGPTILLDTTRADTAAALEETLFRAYDGEWSVITTDATEEEAHRIRQVTMSSLSTQMVSHDDEAILDNILQTHGIFQR
jgi:hypothetical protein